MTPRLFNSPEARNEGWRITVPPGETTHRLSVVDGAGDVEAHVVSRAIKGSIPHRAALTFLAAVAPVEAERVLAVAKSSGAAGPDVQIADLALARYTSASSMVATQNGTGWTLGQPGENYRVRHVDGRDLEKGTVILFETQSIANPMKIQTRGIETSGIYNMTMVGNDPSHGPMFFIPESGEVRKPREGELRSGTYLDLEGKPFLPASSFIADIWIKATAEGRNELVRHAVETAANPGPGFISSLEQDLLDVVRSAQQSRLSAEEVSSRIEELRRAREGQGAHPALAVAGMVAALKIDTGVDAPDPVASDMDESRLESDIEEGLDADDEPDLQDDEDYDEDQDMDVVLARAVPVLDIPQFQDPRLREQAQIWLEPGMGGGFRIENVAAVFESVDESPVIDALVERMSSGETLTYPGVSQGHYQTSEMVSMDDGAYRAVIFSDFMGRYAYITPNEGLEPRIAPRAPSAFTP
jgi:hypothetical protein